MNKLDTQGLLIKDAWERIISDLPEGNTCLQCRIAILTAERDALLELFEMWIDEAKNSHYSAVGSDGFDLLYKKSDALRDKEKPPGIHSRGALRVKYILSFTKIFL